MTAYDVISDMGVTTDMIEDMRGIVGEMPNGCEVKKLNIVTGRLRQAIKIYPKVPWTDGTVRPVYEGGWGACDYNVTVYLNTRI